MGFLKKAFEDVAGTVGDVVSDPFSEKGLGAVGGFAVGGPLGGYIGAKLGGAFQPPKINKATGQIETTGLSEERQAQLDRINLKLGEDIKKEEALRGNLTMRREDRENLLKNIMTQRLGQIEEITGERKAGVGEAASSRNLLRSTFGQRALEEETLRGVEEGAEVKQATMGEIERGRTAERRTLQQLEDRRERLRTQTELAKFEEIEKELQFLDETNVRRAFEMELAQAEMDQRAKNNLIAGLGGFAGAASQLFFAG